MKRFFKTFFLTVIFLFLFVGVISSTAHAQNPPADPAVSPENQPLTNDFTDDLPDFITDPVLEKITDSTKSVKVTFNNLAPNKQYYICAGIQYCFVGLGNPETAGVTSTDNNFDDDELFPAGGKTSSDSVTVTFCGNDDRVKVCSGNDAKDYFFGGKVYSFSIGVKKGDNYTPLKLGFFYVPRSYPTAKLTPQKGLTTATAIKVTLDPVDKNGQPVFRGGGGTGFWRRNNYQISLIGGQGYSKKSCVSWANDKQTSTIGTTFNDLSRGRYTIAVREQTEDDGLDSVIWQSQAGGMVPPIDGDKDTCSGGFLFWRAVCNVTAKAPGGDCTDFKKDPSGEEYSAFLESINELNKITGVYKLPCGNGKPNNTNVPCPKVMTAIGEIDVGTPQAFITAMFRYVLAIAGFGGVILIIVSGYIMMTSAGDKEKVQGARETVTAAIVGLLFIILSIVILEIIGVDLLRLPGFGR